MLCKSRNIHGAVMAALGLAGLMLPALPARAHGGRDLVLLETEDVGEPRTMNAYTSTDTIVDHGERSTELTTGLTYAPNERLLLSPHFHVGVTNMTGWRYSGAALNLRYRMGQFPGTRWYSALSFEVERPTGSHAPPVIHPGGPGDGTGGGTGGGTGVNTQTARGAQRHADEASAPEDPVRTEGTLRLILTGNVGRTMLVMNAIAGRQFASGGERSAALGLGAMRMRPNGDMVALEMLAQLPLRDGVEVLPSYHRQLGKMGLLFGAGLYTSRNTTCGTLHALAIGEF